MIEWLLGWIWWAWDTTLATLVWLGKAIVYLARRYPAAAVGLAYGFVRMWGALIQSGQTGVLFTWGRPRRILEPGFHPLIPIIQQVRKMPSRSITLGLPAQRLATIDGLVFDVDATLVCRISDPIKATVEIDDLRAGCITVLALAVAHVIGSSTRVQLAGKSALDAEISELVQRDLDAWGVTVEQAGLNTIAPTRTTTRVSQQAKRIRERSAALDVFLVKGVSLEAALALIGTTRQVIGRSRARYHRHRLKPRKEEMPVVFETATEDELDLDDELAF